MEGKEEKSIEQLQKEKIQLEINDLNKSWFKRKDYLQVALPATLALFSLIYALVSGFFSNKYEQYQLQKEQLRLEVLYFEQKKEELIKNNESLAKTNAELKSSLDDKTQGILALKGQLTSKQLDLLKKERDLAALKSEASFYSGEVRSLQSDYDSKKQLFQGEFEKQLISEAELNKKMKEKDKTIDRLNNENSGFKHQVQLSLENPFVPKNKQNNYQIWLGKEMIKFYQNNYKKLDEDLKLLEAQEKALEKKSDSAEAKYKSQKIVN